MMGGPELRIEDLKVLAKEIIRLSALREAFVRLVGLLELSELDVWVRTAQHDWRFEHALHTFDKDR
jgi:hypothetical protein